MPRKPTVTLRMTVDHYNDLRDIVLAWTKEPAKADEQLRRTMFYTEVIEGERVW